MGARGTFKWARVNQTPRKQKTSQLVIRIDKTERDAFLRLYDAKDTSAAREIRRFMRNWVVQNTPAPEAIAKDETPEAESMPAPAEAAAAASDDAAQEAPPPEKPAPAKRKRGGNTPA